MKKRIAVFSLSLALLVVSPAAAQLLGPIPVVDWSNLAEAVETVAQLERQYAQLVSTYRQIVLEYQHMLRMATTLPHLDWYRFTPASWRFSSSANTYGNTASWTRAINSGFGALDGYLRAVEHLSAYGPAFARIPADQLDRAKSAYAAVELSDAASIHGIEVAGSQRAKAAEATAAIDALERVTLSDAEELNTEMAVLNKINAAGIMTLRSSQDGNQLLVALLEQSVAEAKARRDAQVSAINADIACRLYARDLGINGIAGTTDAIASFRMP
jgi:hypothetical protein